MTTFAQYPELPDEDSNQTQGQEIGASASVGGTPPSAGTPASKPQGAPTSSGLAQNFGAFQNANKSKLDALKNLTLNRVQGDVDNAGQTFQRDVAKEEGNLAGKQVGFDWSKLTANSSPNDYQEAGKALSAAGQRVDANPAVAAIAGGQSAQDYRLAAERAANVNSKGGTTNALMSGGTNAANATQDALLLRANADYRKAAQDTANKNSVAFPAALDAARAGLLSKADQVNSKNLQSRQAGRDILQGVRQDIDKQVAAQAAQETDAAKLAALQRAQDQEKSFWAEIQKRAADANYATEKGYIDPANAGLKNVLTNISSGLGAKHPAEILQALGMNSADVTKLFSAPTANVSADQIVAKDPALQARISALNALVEGRNYNPTAAPTAQVDNTAAIQALQDRILQAIYGKANEELNSRPKVGAVGSRRMENEKHEQQKRIDG